MENLQLIVTIASAAASAVSALFSVKLWYKLGRYDEKHKSHERRLARLEEKLS